MKITSKKTIFSQSSKTKISSTLFFITALLIIVSAGISNVHAQKGKATKKPVKKKTVKEEKSIVKIDPFRTTNDLCIPEPSDSESLIEIQEDSSISFLARKNSEMPTINKPLSALPEILSRVDKNAVITFKAAPELKFETVKKILFDIRNSTQNCVNIEISTEKDNTSVYLPPEPKENVELESDPLKLVVELKANKKLNLNKDNEGSLSDTSILVNSLKNIFKNREANGVFRGASNEIEKTVFVTASDSNKFGDVMKLIGIIKEVGASPIGLQIDDSQPFVLQMN